MTMRTHKSCEGRKPHAHLFKSGTTWHYRVFDSDGRIVFEDNTGAWHVLVKPAIKRVITVRELETLRLRLPVYADLVEAEFEHHGIPEERLTIQPYDDFSKADGTLDADWQDTPGLDMGTAERLVKELEEQPWEKELKRSEPAWLALADEWIKNHDGEVWESEDGQFLYILGTHSLSDAMERAQIYFIATTRDYWTATQNLPSGRSWSEARHLWVNPKHYEEDFPAEQGHRHWWFGRQRITIVKTD